MQTTTTLILGYGIEFGIQAVFLFLALWIMIKVQKLNCHYGGLIGTAALASGLEMVLDYYLGVSISTPIVCAVLCLCIWKVTGGDQVDVLFTVAVGGALVFGMNLWLLGALMGDLRPSAHRHLVAAARETADDSADPDDAPALTNLSLALSTNAAPSRALSATNLVAAPVKSTNNIVRHLALKGLTRHATHSMLIVDTGLRAYTIVLGETVTMDTPAGTGIVKFEKLASSTVTLTVDGDPVEVPLR
ncbi:MAG: hypothetical protein U1F98_08810 [Verrucomicrobiota bacterium]